LIICAAHNGHVVRKLIADGERDEDVLLDRLSRWPEAYAQSPCPITFLGLCLTYACNAQPKCVYCNQRPTPELLSDGDWRRVIEDAAVNPPQGGTFIYMTGGEPLLLGNRLYGDGGLIEFATRLGCAVNLNTNGLLITPEVALRLVGSGLARLHLSLDSADPDVHDALAGASGRHAAVLQGLMDLQIARELLGANHPVIHINCVLTKYNAFGFPRLLEKLLRMKRVRSPGSQRSVAGRSTLSGPGGASHTGWRSRKRGPPVEQGRGCSVLPADVVGSGFCLGAVSG
jgi:sulfatase maturation enzyme AslB (radical SAM superfamily)